MVAPRAAWKGFLKVRSVTRGVKIVGATNEASKIHFKIEPQGRSAGQKHPCRREDRQAGRTDDQFKGSEIEKDVQIEPDDIKALKLTSDHTLGR